MSGHLCNPTSKRTHSIENKEIRTKRQKVDNQDIQIEPIIYPHPDFYKKSEESSLDNSEDAQIELYKYKQKIKKSLKAHYKLINHQIPTSEGSIFVKWIVDMLHKCMAMRYTYMYLEFYIENGLIYNITCNYNELVNIGIASKIIKDSLNITCNDNIRKQCNGIIIKARDCLRSMLPETVLVTISNTLKNPRESIIELNFC